MKSYDKEDILNLIVACREHDDYAFAELVRRYMPMMRSVVARYADASLDADELLQEASVALHSAAMRYDIAQREVTFGLFARICVSHRMLDLLRVRRPLPLDISEADTVSQDDDGIERGLVSREMFDSAMECARDVLSEYEYKVMILHIQGYKTAEIAKALGKSAKSVDNAKFRLFRRLRENLGGISV